MLTLYVLFSSRFYLGSALMITIILTRAVKLTLNYSLQWAVPFFPQNCKGAFFRGDRERCRSPFAWGICTQSNTWFLRSTRVHNPNGISIGLAVFAGLTIVTDGQTDQRTWPCNNRPHLRSTAMRYNEYSDNNSNISVYMFTCDDHWSCEIIQQT